MKWMRRFSQSRHAPFRSLSGSRSRRAQVRMPAIEEFPPQVKKQIEAQQRNVELIAEHAQKKKPGLFQASRALASAARTIRRPAAFPS